MFSAKSLVDVMDVLNYEQKNLSVWFRVNKLSFNMSKTNYMIFKHTNDNIDHKIIINRVCVEKVHVTTCLAVKVDEHYKLG